MRSDASTASCGGRPRGYEVEAGPRHAEILGAMLGDDGRAVSTPGIKERAEAPRGQCRPAEEEDVGTFEARTSDRAAKVQELQQQIRDLAAQLTEGARQVEEARRGDGAAPSMSLTARLPQSIVPSEEVRHVRFGGTKARPVPPLAAVATPGHSGHGRKEEEAQEEGSTGS